MNPLYMSVALLGVGMLILFLELFVPSGGLLGVLAASCFLGSVIFGFAAGVSQGLMMLVVNLVIVPVFITIGLKVWPHTPIGKSMLVASPREEDVLVVNEEYQQLVGKRGVAATKMLPSGAVRVDNKSYDAVSSGMAIDEGEGVQVVQVRGNRIVVQPFDGPFEEFPQTAEEFFPPPSSDFEANT